MLAGKIGKKDLSDLVLLMRLSGGWYDFEGKKAPLLCFLQKIRMYYFAIAFAVMFICSCQTGIKNVLTSYFFLVSAGFYIVPQGIIYYLKRDKAMDIVNKLRKIHQKRTEPWKSEMFDREAGLIWRLVIWLGYCSLMFVLFYFTIPLIYDIYLVNTSDYDRDPFRFSYPLEEIADERRDFLYYAVMLCSLLWCAQLFCYGFVSIGFQTIICHYCCIEIRILRRTIAKGGKMKLLNDRHFLRTVVTDHQDLLRVVKEAKEVIGAALAVQIASGSLMLTAYLYSVIKLKDDMLMVVMNVVFFTIMTSVKFISCYLGELLQTEGFKLFETLCTLPWDEMTPKTRKDFSFILLMARRPMIINYKGLLPVNLESFQFMMNSCYSYLMLLNSLK